MTYRRSWWTGVDSIEVEGEESQLTGFWAANRSAFDLEREQTGLMRGTPVTIRARRPRWVGGLRPHDYTVLVDGRVVLTRHGY
ncbi:hypothetical protein [Nocardioides sp. InS609-2]|uniref:hypothetical protein n=1 Tax=Nocardioides sp. InS609-2 TaxID=2760705 RepID=UPI0020C02FD4|nr:hypothetical protein [Nocardioides sp. InS609-2]